jgi:DNA-binding NtrC family response regulator
MGYSKLNKELQFKADKLKSKNIDIYIEGEVGSGRDFWVQYINNGFPLEKIQSSTFESDTNILMDEITEKISIYIDSIENLSLDHQNYLFRILEKREIKQKGKSFPIHNVFTSGTPLIKTLIQEKKFRNDLFQKLSSVQVSIPALRDRKEDIPFFLQLFIEELNKKHKKKIKEFTDGFLDYLMNQKWLGNLAELHSFLETLVIFSKGTKLEKRYIPIELRNSKLNLSNIKISPGYSLKEYEREIIISNLQFTSMNRKKTSEILGISERNLYRKIKEYSLENLD